VAAKHEALLEIDQQIAFADMDEFGLKGAEVADRFV
jgi:hypothetical protein